MFVLFKVMFDGDFVAGFGLFITFVFDAGFVLVFVIVVELVTVLVTGDGFLLLSSSFDLFES